MFLTFATIFLIFSGRARRLSPCFKLWRQRITAFDTPFQLSARGVCNSALPQIGAIRNLHVVATVFVWERKWIWNTNLRTPFTKPSRLRTARIFRFIAQCIQRFVSSHSLLSRLIAALEEDTSFVQVVFVPLSSTFSMLGYWRSSSRGKDIGTPWCIHRYKGCGGGGGRWVLPLHEVNWNFNLRS